MQKVFTLSYQKYNNFWEWFLKQNMSFSGGLVSFLMVCLIRVGLENFSTSSFDGLLTKPLYVINFIVFYASVFLSIMLIIKLFTRLNVKQIFTIHLFFFWITALVPVFDILFSGGMCIDYLQQTGWSLVRQAVTLDLGHNLTCGLSWGIRWEVIIYILGIFAVIYRYAEKKKVVFAILGSLYGFMSLMILHIGLVGVIGTIGLWFTHGYQGGSVWITQALLQNNQLYKGILNGIIHVSAEPVYHVWMIFSSRLLLIFASISLFILCYVGYKNIFHWITRILSWRRIMFYFSIMLAGMVFAPDMSFIKIINPVDITGIVSVWFTLVYYYITATVINDNEDEDVDKISHRDRPLISGSIEKTTFKNIGVLSMIVGFLFSTTLSYEAAFFFIVWQGIYYVYSAKPFKFKRHWLLSYLTYIALGATTLLIGYFTISPDRIIENMPIQIILILAFFLGISSFVKDVPDVEGDKVGNIHTFPVVFGVFYTMVAALGLYGIGSIIIGNILQSQLIIHYGIISSVIMIIFMAWKEKSLLSNIATRILWTRLFISMGSIMFLVIMLSQL